MFATDTWSLYVSILLVVYAIVIIFFVVRGMLKTKNIDDFAIGSKGFPAWAVGLSLAASMTSAATFIINPGFMRSMDLQELYPLGSSCLWQFLDHSYFI